VEFWRWWVNCNDPEGKNLFSGGFLGLSMDTNRNYIKNDVLIWTFSNIGVFDRRIYQLEVLLYHLTKELEPNVKMTCK